MKSAPALPVKVAQVKSAEEEKEVIPTRSKSGPTSKKTYKRTHEEEQDGEGDEVEVTTAIKPQSKAGASYKPKPGPSLHHLLLVVRRVHAFQRIYSWWSWKKAPWLVYAWFSSCSSSCVRVDVFLGFGA